MHAQLAALVAELDRATEGFHRLLAELPGDRFATRPSPERWSVAENVAHLNLTAGPYLPAIDDMLAEARRRGRVGAGHRYRKDVVGWLLHRALAPGQGPRAKTSAAFIPESVGSPASLMAEFERLQGELASRVRASDGLAVDRVKMCSSFNARIRYNGYACFAILAQHALRHLHQADGVRRDLAGRA